MEQKRLLPDLIIILHAYVIMLINIFVELGGGVGDVLVWSREGAYCLEINNVSHHIRLGFDNFEATELPIYLNGTFSMFVVVN